MRRFFIHQSNKLNSSETGNYITPVYTSVAQSYNTAKDSSNSASLLWTLDITVVKHASNILSKDPFHLIFTWLNLKYSEQRKLAEPFNLFYKEFHFRCRTEAIYVYAKKEKKSQSSTSNNLSTLRRLPKFALEASCLL